MEEEVWGVISICCDVQEPEEATEIAEEVLCKSSQHLDVLRRSLRRALRWRRRKSRSCARPWSPTLSSGESSCGHPKGLMFSEAITELSIASPDKRRSNCCLM